MALEKAGEHARGYRYEAFGYDGYAGVDPDSDFYATMNIAMNYMLL